MNHRTRIHNRLYQLFRDNQPPKGPNNKGPGYRMEKAAEGNEATIYLYDAIGGWYGIDAEQFAQDLAGIDADVIHLRINSPGGDVFDGRAIATSLKAHRAKVVAHIDGLAASAATYVALAANEVEIAKGAFFMIHNGWTIAIGNASEMEKVVALLRRVDTSIVQDYQGKTNIDEQQLRDWMAEETWFTAEEAVEHGFADSLFDGNESDTNNLTHFNLAAYANTPAALLEPPKAEEPPPQYDRAAMERRLQLLERTAP
jgi:ATP-dependent Clp protease protease subunit